MMTPAELQSLASAVYGARWQSPLSRDMDIALRTVQKWAADGIPKHATSEGVRRFLEERRIARITAPPAGSSPDDDRDDACADALEPAILAMVGAAREVGWAEPEVYAAILSIIVSEMRERAGDAPTRQTLAAVIQMIDE